MARLFLCHANEDKPQVRKVYQRLKVEGFEPWFDEEALLPGQLWRQEIPKALRSSDFILIFFSQTSIRKIGYVQNEFKLALDTWKQIPEGMIHTIPVLLDNCDVPEQFREFHWVALSDERGFQRILRAIQAGLAQRQQTTSETVNEEITVHDEESTGKDNLAIEIQVRIHFEGELFTAELHDEFFAGKKHYYLKIKVDIPRDALIRNFETTYLISTREEIEIQRQRGVGSSLRIDLVETLPDNLQPVPDCLYFAIDHHGWGWNRIEQRRNIAVYCDLPSETEMVLLAVPST